MNHRTAIILMGPPGSGKTVITEHLALSQKIATLEMGRLLREEVKQETSLGHELEPLLVAGHLAPLPIVIEAVQKALQQIERDIVLFDGFPRQLDQVEPLFQLSRQFNLQLAAVLVLHLSSTTIMQRLSGRRVCPNCGAVYNIHSDPPARQDICDRCGAKLEQRRDDTPEVVAERLQTYESQTAPVIDYFQANYPHLVYQIPAEKSIPDLLETVSAALMKAGLEL